MEQVFFQLLIDPKKTKKPFLHYCCSVCTNRGSKKGEWLWTQLMSKYWFFPYLSFGLCPYFLLFCLHHQMFLTSYSIHVLHQIKLLFSSTSTGEQIVELQATNLKNLVPSWIVQKTEVVGYRTPEVPYAVSICTRILKYRVWKIDSDELEFLSSLN